MYCITDATEHQYDSWFMYYMESQFEDGGEFEIFFEKKIDPLPIGTLDLWPVFLLYPTFFVGRQQTIVYLLYDSLVFYCLY